MAQPAIVPARILLLLLLSDCIFTLAQTVFIFLHFFICVYRYVKFICDQTIKSKKIFDISLNNKGKIKMIIGM